MNINSQNNIAYTLDKLSAAAYGVCISHEHSGIDLREADYVSRLYITGSQPSGTERYFAFNTGLYWFRLNTDGTAQMICHIEPDYYTLREQGNTAEQLNALTSIPAFAHKLVRTAVALSSVDPENIKPSALIYAAGHVSTQTNSFTQLSPMFDLEHDSCITDIADFTSTSDGGSVILTGKLIRDDGESDWLSTANLKGARGNKLQLRAVYNAPIQGNSYAKLSSVKVSYSQHTVSANTLSGRIYSVTSDWYINIKAARINIRHSPLNDSSMKVYAAFRKSPGHVVKESLGISPASRKTYQLQHTNGIRYDTFRLYADGQQVAAGYELNAQAGRVTFTAPEGSVITCSYDYAWDNETWHELKLSSRYSLDDYDMSEYRLAVAEADYSVGAFLILIEGTQSTVAGETLGISHESPSTFPLKHKALSVERIYYDDNNIPTANYLLQDNSLFVEVAAPLGKTLKADYVHMSEPVQLFQVCAVFSA